MSIRCYHCGDVVTNHEHIIKNEQETLYFCCNGCKQAYLFINSIGYGSYYLKREDYAEKPKENVEFSIFEFIEKQLPEKSLQDTSYQITKFKESNFYIKGLHCASCVWINEKVVSSLDGVLEVNVSYSANRIYLKWDPTRISLKDIVKNIYKIGYEVIPIDEKLEQPQKWKSDKLLKKMAVAGFFTGNNMLISAALYAGYFDYIDPFMKQFLHYISFFFATPVFFYSATEFFRSAFYSLKHRILGMDILTSAGITLAYVYSIYITFTHQVDKEVFFDAICFVVFAILTGRFIESRLKLRTYHHTSNLVSLLPSIVRKLKNYHYIQIVGNTFFLNSEQIDIKENDFEFTNIDLVEKNDVILVYPNEIVPLDSRLLNESAEVEEASLTGEFKPILKVQDQFIISGSKNISPSILFLQVINTKKESTISKILQMAEDSIKDKSRAESLAERASAIFIGFVLILSGIVFTFWYFYRNDLPNAILITLSTLIVACPCALSLSIPTAVLAGVQKLFSWGCLVKNSTSLELLGTAKIVAFDKTGTLTYGNFSFESILSFIPEKDLYEIIKVINQYQKMILLQHPITTSFIHLEKNWSSLKLQLLKNPYENQDLDIQSLDKEKYEIQYVSGSGIKLSNSKFCLYLGSRKWFFENEFLIEDEWDFQEGVVEVFLGFERKLKNEKNVLAIFLLRDTIKENAKELIFEINKNFKTVLLTGDNEKNARWVSQQIGIHEVHHSLKPEEKAKIIKELQKNAKVLMIGDGINDTIALKQADLGISFVDASKLALYSSEILLLNPNLLVIKNMIDLSRYTLRKMKQNLFLSFLYNTLLLPLAMIGFINPFVGSVFMSLSSITVVANSLTILKFQPKNLTYLR
ncbi:MAG: heavy metal translocating P-type ATPase [Leptospiraceae bacterium]|nr:heavy metal translocating P-type ATPase [Leptospiraceae bacterium]MDW7977000.1 heavy metal translocating P-type ATPase metal-binding domain-containing protein [Leptospiraceae bacterium]